MILTILRILYLRLRNNPTELSLVFVMPVIFFSIFAGIFSSGIATGSDKKLRVGWISSRPTSLGTELREFLDSNSSLQCVSLDPQDSDEAIDDATMASRISDAQKSGKCDVIVKLPAEFPFKITAETTPAALPVSLVTDGQNPIAVSMVTSFVRGFFAQKRASVAAEQLMNLRSGTARPSEFPGPESPGDMPSPESTLAGSESRTFRDIQDPSELYSINQGSDWLRTDPHGVHTIDGLAVVPRRWAIAPNATDESTPPDHEMVLAQKPIPSGDEFVSIVVENPQATSQENPRIAMYAAGIAVLFLLFSATGSAAALLEEAESGTLDRILVSRASLFHIVSGKWLGILLLGCLQISVMFLWAEAVYKIQLFKHLAGFCIMTFSTAAATASFAMLLATICKSRAQLNAASVVIILSMSAVGGSMIPRFAMSARMKEIGKWTFNAWALDGYQKVFWYQAPVSSLQEEVTVLLGSSLVLGLVTLILSRRWKMGSFGSA